LICRGWIIWFGRTPAAFTGGANTLRGREILVRMSGVYGLMTNMLYGTGMRLMECVRLRVKDVILNGARF
jgi:integrase